MFEWHKKAWAQRFAGAAPPQSLLLVAARGSGEVSFARALAQAQLCGTRGADGLACGHCDDCRWFMADAHPDFLLLDPAIDREEEEGEEGADVPADKGRRKRREIGVKEVRAAGAFIRISPARNRVRVVMLRPAESLNAVAANALLKDLEEPPASARFILVSNAPGRLLATVRSRCVRFVLPPPSAEEAAAWLEARGQAKGSLALAQAGGMPEAAAALDERYWQVRATLLERLGNPAAGIAGLDVLDPDWATVVHVAQTWAWDLMSARFSLGVRYHPDRLDAILAMARRVDPLAVAGFERRLAQARRLLEHPLNVRLQTEQILIESQDL
jgi:DNA polymerase-3 subunit delta'